MTKNREYIRKEGNMRCLRAIVMVMTVLLMISCGHRRRTEVRTDGSVSTGTTSFLLEKTVQSVNANRQESQFVTSKISLTMKAGEKDVNVGGHLRMKRDDVIQLSLTALGIMEVGRMELTPDYLMVVDRMGRQYVQASYEEVKFLKSAGVDFFTFQSLFWDELFLPGDRGAKPQSSAFGISAESERVVLSYSPSKQTSLTFLVDVLQEMVERTSLAVQGTEKKPVLEWQYAAFERLGNQLFPTEMKISVPGVSMPIQATIRLRNLKSDSGWQTRTQLNTKRYKRVPLETVLKQMMNLVKEQ